VVRLGSPGGDPRPSGRGGCSTDKESGIMKKESIGFLRGKVRTFDAKTDMCEALLVEKGVITILGSSLDVERAARSKGIPTLDLDGKAVLPGPIDTHFHLVHTGLDLSAIDLGQCRSVDEVLQLVRERARAAGPKDWILGRGLDEFKIREGRPPTAEELDKVAPSNPVYLGDRGIHYCQLNTLAFRKIGLDVGAPGVRADDRGRATGQIMEESIGEAWRRFLADMDEAARRKGILDGLRCAASCGLTCVHAMDGGDFSGDGEVELLLDMLEEVPVRVRVHWNTWEVDRVVKAGLKVLGGDIWLDGSLGSRTAALLSGYTDAPRERGLLYHPNDRIEAFVRECLEADVQVGFHAIGDRSIEQALNCFEAACAGRDLPDRRFRLDHFGLPSKNQIRRAARLGVVISTQPTFPTLRGGPGSVYETRIGKERVARAYPLRELLDAGLLVAGGSDSNVLPADVMLAFHSAVNHPNESERISVEDVVRLYTENAARSEFEEKERGNLAVGKCGDMIVVDDDPCAVRPDRIKDIKVVMTVVDGRLVYQGAN
jgi:predicted amidohydrolase YtcJ